MFRAAAKALFPACGAPGDLPAARAANLAGHPVILGAATIKIG